MPDVTVQLTINVGFYREMAAETAMTQKQLRKQMYKEMQDQIDELDYRVLLNLALRDEGQSLSSARAITCVA